MTKLKNLIVFDLDGVITSEEAYWDCAGLTLHELLYSPRYWCLARNASYRPAATAQESRATSRETLPEWLIQSFKARSLNSNWDTSYAAICLHLVDLLARLPGRAALLPLEPYSADWMARLRAQFAATNLGQSWDAGQLQAVWREQHPFDQPVFSGVTGLELFERMDTYASHALGEPIEGVFPRNEPFWRFCQDRFQEWLLGDTLYAKTHGHAPAQPGKPGCLFFEEPLLPVEQIRDTLSTLRERGYTLGMATGRVRQEAAKPLEKYDLWRYFDEQHMGTYDLVTRAEKELRARGDPTALGKPHSFHFQAAVDWEKALRNALSQSPEPLDTPFIVVGDSTSDILGGLAAGALTVAVLTGASSPEAHTLLLKSQPDFVIEDIRKLPLLLVQLDSLAAIQNLQFQQREIAEKLLRLWFARHLDLPTESVRLTPKAVSLNSFNGFYRSDGEELFFKTHVEEHGVLHEYYHAQLLEKAGYNIAHPLRLLREKERQMVIYPVIKWPVMFDLVRAVEVGQELPAGVTEETLVAAEREECERLLRIYAATFEKEQDASNAPIHQLFWHRLTGARFRQFYLEKELALPASSETVAFERLRDTRWIINGIEQPSGLGELVRQAREVLRPTHAEATVVGHGDAHFGNVFLEDTGETWRYLYFDPAFAGHHSPLLDVVKPLFHNVFATWMYFRREVARDLRISVKLEGERVIIEHNYRLASIRRALLRTKQEHLLTPLLAWLKEQHALPENWREMLNLALMCCPLLTIDLFDGTKMPPEIGWLGLSQAVQLGNRGIEPWLEEEL